MRNYDDSDAALMNDADECHGCHRAPADIGDLCEACWIEDEEDRREVDAERLRKIAAKREAEEGAA